MASLTDKQRGVLRGMSIAMLLSLIAVLGAPFVEGLPRAGDGRGERLTFALRCVLPLVVCLLVHIGALARHRFRTPEDIDGGGVTQGSERARALQAMLQNTLEQVVLAALIYLIWAAMVPVKWTASLPLAAGCFVVGRIAFARGYMRGAPARALGFALTFYPTVIMTAVVVVGWVHGMVVGL